MASETALELDTAAAGYTRGTPVHFAGFPGVWTPGEPIAVSALGFPSDEAALAMVEEQGLPLVETEVEAGSAPMPARPNHILSEEQQRVLDLETRKNWPPATHKEADAAAEAAGVDWPQAKMTVAAKVALLDELRSGEPEPGEPEPGEPEPDEGADG